MAGGVYGWAEDKAVSGSNRWVPVTHLQYIDALEQALRELSFIWPMDGRIMGDRTDNSWLERVRKSLGLSFAEGGALPSSPEGPRVSYVVRREEERFGYLSDEEPLEMIVSNTGNCRRGHAIWSLNGGAPEHIIPFSKVKSGEYQEILDCQEELEQMQKFGL